MPIDVMLQELGRLVWRASWQAAVLAAFVCLLVSMLRHRLSPAWRYALWSLVLVRLLLPLTPQARWSPFNVAYGVGEQRAPVVPDSAAAQGEPNATIVRPTPGITAPRISMPAPAVAPVFDAAGPARSTSQPIPPMDTPATGGLWSTWTIISFAWILGVIVFALSTATKALRLHRASAAWCAATDARLVALAERCRTRLNLRRRVRLYIAPDNQGPATLGLFRPMVVLPESVATELASDQLEAVLLHEYAHVRRHDVVVHWLMTLARTIHWFNPIAWLALARMAGEREQACDKLALDVLGRRRRQSYGDTVLLLVERFAAPAPAPGVVPILGSKHRLRTRIEAIARWSPIETAKRSVAVAALLILAAFGLTDAVRSSAPPEPPQLAAKLGEPAVAQNAADKKALNEEAATDALVWLAGTTIEGRVLDHEGNPVADAEVVLLGDDKIEAFASERQDGSFRLTYRGDKSSTPLSKRTDANGRFTIRRDWSAVNRIAVLSQEVLLWVVHRKDFAQATDFDVKLPKPGAFVLHCDIPNKPPEQEFSISLESFDGVKWDSDKLFVSDVKAPNPGERVVSGLPSGKYVIQRVNFTVTGKRSSSMTHCERKFLPVRAGEQTEVHFDRKIGVPVDIQVTGLGDAPLRCGHVKIQYLGPEERPWKNGRRMQVYTAFDVFPIESDGRITTPPIPPGSFDLSLFAVRASTPRSATTHSDFLGGAKLVVPKEGAVAPVKLIARRVNNQSPKADPDAPRLEVRANDESGEPIENFEVGLAGKGGVLWERSVGGLAAFSPYDLRDWVGGELMVRAAGYASKVLLKSAITKPEIVKIKLQRGREIHLRIRDSDGKPLDTELRPMVTYSFDRVEARRPLPESSKRRAQVLDRINFFGLQKTSGNDFVFNVPTDAHEPLYLSIDQPGMLRFFQSEAVDVSKFDDGVWEARLPAPATIDVAFAQPLDAQGRSPFKSAYYTLLPMIPDHHGSVPVLASGTLEGESWSVALTKLAPGKYSLYVETTPRLKPKTYSPLGAHPGRFHDRRLMDLHAGEHAAVAFKPPAFDADAWRGNRSVDVRVVPFGEQSLAGKSYNVWYMLAHYGELLVTEGKLGADGKISLDGVAASGDDPFGGDYQVHIEGEYLGKFRIEDESKQPAILLRMKPKKGDMAPDAVTRDAETGAIVPLASFRGKIVFLEFWATWCGPCRLPMEKLSELAKRKTGKWIDRAALVAVSIDDDRELLRRHLRARGLAGPRHLWSRDLQRSEGVADAARQASSIYGIHGVPSAFLLDTNGRIVWHGHPASIDVEATIDALLSDPSSAVVPAKTKSSARR